MNKYLVSIDGGYTWALMSELPVAWLIGQKTLDNRVKQFATEQTALKCGDYLVMKAPIESKPEGKTENV